jgi:hypothetical protein
VYPILDLSRHTQDLHWYLRSLEEVLIRALASTSGLTGERVAGLTGVWVDGHKLAAIGVRARKWVTYHGLALNVSTGVRLWLLVCAAWALARQRSLHRVGVRAHAAHAPPAAAATLLVFTHNLTRPAAVPVHHALWHCRQAGWQRQDCARDGANAHSQQQQQQQQQQ